MQINYIDEENTITINDGIKTQYWLLNFLAVLAITNAIIYPVFISDYKKMSWLVLLFWVLIGISSLVGLLYNLTKKTATAMLKLESISYLNERQIFGKKRYSLKLKNGKQRDLIELKSPIDILEAKRFFKDIGIETNQMNLDNSKIKSI